MPVSQPQLPTTRVRALAGRTMGAVPLPMPRRPVPPTAGPTMGVPPRPLPAIEAVHAVGRTMAAVPRPTRTIRAPPAVGRTMGVLQSPPVPVTVQRQAGLTMGAPPVLLAATAVGFSPLPPATVKPWLPELTDRRRSPSLPTKVPQRSRTGLGSRSMAAAWRCPKAGFRPVRPVLVVSPSGSARTEVLSARKEPVLATLRHLQVTVEFCPISSNVTFENCPTRSARLSPVPSAQFTPELVRIGT